MPLKHRGDAKVAKNQPVKPRVKLFPSERKAKFKKPREHFISLIGSQTTRRTMWSQTVWLLLMIISPLHPLQNRPEEEEKEEEASTEENTGDQNERVYFVVVVET